VVNASGRAPGAGEATAGLVRPLPGPDGGLHDRRLNSAELRKAGAVSLRELATGLNDRGMPTACGATWSPVQVSRALACMGYGLKSSGRAMVPLPCLAVSRLRSVLGEVGPPLLPRPRP
jgi:hypothetical protein